METSNLSQKSEAEKNLSEKIVRILESDCKTFKGETNAYMALSVLLSIIAQLFWSATKDREALERAMEHMNEADIQLFETQLKSIAGPNGEYAGSFFCYLSVRFRSLISQEAQP